MRILLVGDGKVGHTIAERLTLEGHDVVIIDQDEEPLRHSEDTLDVLCVRGNGANAKVLLDAQADKAEILIATTASDETNMLCCLIAKRLGTKYVIARIRDPEYNESLQLLQHELGIDLAVNPERLTALEISRLLRYPFASNIESFAKGRIELVEFRAMEKDGMIDLPLRDLQRRHRGLPQVLYVTVERGGNVIIPNGDFIIRPEDRVFVAADMVTITAYFQYLGRNTLRVRNVMLLGGGRISYYLARMIVPMGINVSMIEINESKADYLSSTLRGVDVIHGDGTDQELLDQEGISEMDAFVSLSDRDEENLLTGVYAAHRGVPKVIVKNNRVTYADVVGALGLDSIVSPKTLTCDTILRYVRGRVNGGRGTKIERLYRLLGGRIEALEFIARAGDAYINTPLKDLKVRPGMLIAAIVHQSRVIVPFGNDHIEEGDNVVVIARESGINDLNEVIHK